MRRCSEALEVFFKKYICSDRVYITKNKKQRRELKTTNNMSCSLRKYVENPICKTVLYND